MRAVVLEQVGGPEVLVPREVDAPVARPGWVEVELRAAALNWHDVLVRRGAYGSPLPHIAGADGAGVRSDTGESVVVLPSLFWGDSADAPAAGFQILGDTTPGTYAERVLVPAGSVAPAPQGWSWEEAAGLSLAGVTVYRALVTRARMTAGESLLIIGAGGGVSTMAVSVANALGVDAFVTASSSAKLDRARAGGAAGGVLHIDDDWENAAHRMPPGGGGFDVVLDAVGLWPKSVRALRPGGRLVVLGANGNGRADMDVRAFFFGQYSLLGTTMGGPADFRGLLDLVEQGSLARPVIAQSLPLEQAAQGHRILEAGNHFGKVVLTM